MLEIVKAPTKVLGVDGFRRIRILHRAELRSNLDYTPFSEMFTNSASPAVPYVRMGSR